MLAERRLSLQQNRPRARQGGVVLVIALIVLVAMTLAAIAMVRSVDTGNLIAGNMAFQQAAVHSGDSGVETAIGWLEDCNSNTATCASATLNNDSPSNGYAANGSNGSRNPNAGESWDSYWARVMSSCSASTPNVKCLATQSGTGNMVSYVIDRMCNSAGAKTTGALCVASPMVNAATGNSEEAGEIQLNAPSVVYYRITVRIAGPRNSVSYVQAMVSM
jgi:Tfp pilus assembly protein PilX